ncbi:MAG: hypothetical protein O3B95_05600, partial [Chloroflexi bacterium]|nr:hypothetical protein [Chloroflexota bacterium]
MARDTELLDALVWRPSPPVASSLEFAFLAWDFEKPTPAFQYAVELPEAKFKPMYADFVSAAYAATLDTIGDLTFPPNFGKGPGLLAKIKGFFPGMKSGRETDELWSLAVTWEFDTWLERILRINGGVMAAARELIEDRCPVPDYISTAPDLKAELLNYPDDPNTPDVRVLLRWMGIRGWDDDRIRKIVQENSIMLNDW